MAFRARKLTQLLLLPTLLLGAAASSALADARFDLVGPRIDVRVYRGDQNLPIAAVPNLQPGDRLWLHPDLPPSQSVKYLLICVFLRGNTNPPPDDWFVRIETWDHKVREEGVFVKVPAEAQQALLFMAPETGGDFSTLRSAVQGRPGAFVRASQDLTEAGFEQARIEKYLASIRLVPPTDPKALQQHSELLSRTLALKPNDACFKQPVDTQFTCLTQSGSQIVLDDGHGNNIINALSNGQGSDFIQAASYTSMAGGGLYSAYVGAIVDLVRIMSNLHTAKYQYIPAIAFPQDAALNLRLNTPPSFHDPKSVLVISLPSVQKAVPPPLRTADATHVACLLQPSVVLPIEGAPLVFSADFAHDLVLHLNTPAGAPAEPDIPLTADAFQGGLVLQQTPEHHVPLRDPLADTETVPSALTHPDLAGKASEPKKQREFKPGTPGVGEPIRLTGTIQGRWGFDAFTGPTVPLQQLPGTGWQIAVTPASTDDHDEAPIASDLIAGHAAELVLTSTGSACIHTITAHPTGLTHDLKLEFKPDPKTEDAEQVRVTLPSDRALAPGDLHVQIQQYGQPTVDHLAARTFSEPAHINSIELHAGDRTLVVEGSHLTEIATLTLGDLVFSPEPFATASTETATAASQSEPASLQFSLPANAPTPPTHVDEHLTAAITLRDGRSISRKVIVAAARPVILLLSKTAQPSPGTVLTLINPDDLALSSRLTFTVKSPSPFPRNGQLEIETLDGTLRTVLTLAPSGGLLLQDPHTVVAALDPLSSFGPSAFGALRVRAIYPEPEAPRSRRTADSEPDTPHAHEATAAESTSTDANESRPEATTAPTPAEPPSSNWLPLVTLVRLPVLTQLQCSSDLTLSCTLTGSNLFLIQAVSADPAFAEPTTIPDGYTGTTLSVPHPAASTLFFRLRDDPTAINSADVPSPPPAPAPATSTPLHHHAATHPAHTNS